MLLFQLKGVEIESLKVQDSIDKRAPDPYT